MRVNTYLVAAIVIARALSLVLPTDNLARLATAVAAVYLTNFSQVHGR